MNAETSRRELTIILLAHILETDASRIRAGDHLRDDLGLDSLQSLELLSVLAEELRIDLPMDQAMDLRTVDDACRFVEDAWIAQRGASDGADGGASRA